MVHINDGTLNDEAIIPFGGMGDSGNGGRYGGEASLDTFTEWQWVTVRDEPADLPVLIEATTRGIDHRCGQAGRGLDRDRLARRLVGAVRGQPGDPRPRARGGADPRLRPERPRARAAEELHPGRRGGRPRHHRPVLLGGGPRRRGRGGARRLPGHHLQLRPHRRARELVRPPAALDARGHAHLRGQRAGRPGGQRRDGASTSPRCAATARPWSTSRPTPRARPRSASTTPAGSRR